MFTKWGLPAVIVLALLIGLGSGFAADNPRLAPQYAEAPFNLGTERDIAAQLGDQVGGMDNIYRGIAAAADQSKGQLNDIKTILAELSENARKEAEADADQKSAVDAVVAVSEAHAKETGDVLDTVLSNILGKPIGQTFGKRANIKVFSLKEAGYRGYMAKVKLHDPDAVRLVLAGDKVGSKGETTSAAAERTDAVLALNAGGFAKQDGLMYPMGITVVDGEIKTFYSTELSFIGFNKSGNLVGGEITTREQIEELGIVHGATFIPTLLQDGKKLDIPSKYQNKKEPRTLIGHFSNGDLLFIVIDGRQKESSGVTLEEAQTKLLEWNVRDAYNLDGGGSSTFVYKGKVLNSPSDGSERKVVSNFIITP